VAVWLQAKVREDGFGLQPSLYASSVCDAQLPCSFSVRLVVLCLCLCIISYALVPNLGVNYSNWLIWPFDFGNGPFLIVF